MEEKNTVDLSELILLGKQILAELQLLTSSTKAAALIRFQREFLATDQQRLIFESFDGERDSQAIAGDTGINLRSIQRLIRDLQEKDLIDFEKRGKAIIPIKSAAKVATYYAAKDIDDGGQENG